MIAIMKKRLSNVSEQFTEFFARVTCWSWDTFESLLDILLDFLARMLEFILAMMNLFFQVMCFLRDLCIDSMRTYLNVFHGIVNVIKSIKCDDVEDFASACIVVILWIEAIGIVLRLVKQNPRMKIWAWFDRKIKQENNHLNANSKAYDHQYCTCKKSGKRRGRYVKRLQNTISEKDLVE